MNVRAIFLLVLAGALAMPAIGATPSQWARRANAICAQMNRQQRAIPDPKNAAELLASLVKIHGLVARTVAGLDALPEPAGKGTAIRELLATVRAANRTLAQAIAAFRGARVPAAQALLRRTSTQFARANRLSLRLGARECAK